MRDALAGVVLHTAVQIHPETEYLREVHAVHALPTFVLMSGAGEVIASWIGYSKAGFLETLHGALGDPTTIAEKRTRFGQTPTSDLAVTLAVHYESRGDFPAAVRFYREAEACSHDQDTSYLGQAFAATLAAVRDSLMTLDHLARAADELLSSIKSTPADMVRIGTAMARAIELGGDPARLKPYIAAANIAIAEDPSPEAAIARAELSIPYELYVTGDHEKAAEQKRASLPADWSERADGINAFAWWCFEHRIQLEEAEALARRGVALADPGPPKAMILDTLAEICHARGHSDEALAFIEQAVVEDPEEPYFIQQRERFREIVVRGQ